MGMIDNQPKEDGNLSNQTFKGWDAAKMIWLAEFWGLKKEQWVEGTSGLCQDWMGFRRKNEISISGFVLSLSEDIIKCFQLQNKQLDSRE